MKITTSSDWRDAIPFETPLLAAEAVPGEPVRCAGCGPSSEPRGRDELWVVKHRHPNNHAGFVRYYCADHRPAVSPRPAASTAVSAQKAPRQRAAAAPRERRLTPTIPERVPVLCPDCFVQVPATGICGMCGQPVG